MLFKLLGDKMLPGDLHLFLIGIAAQLDNLHTVQQRAGNGVGGIGRGDEHDPAQVHGDFQEMISEAAVLLAIQHLQQSGGGIATHIAGQLVDLIQHQQGVHGSAVDQAVNDAAGHSAYVSLAVTADVCLIPHAAQADAVELAIHSLGNGDSDGGLAHTRRAHKTNDLALGLGMDLAHGDVLQDTLLHLGQAVVVLIQHGPSLFHIRPLLGLLAPGHFQAGVQVIADHRCLGAAVGLLCQARNLLHQLFSDFLGDIQLLNFFRILLNFIVAVLAQLMLQYLHLLPQNHVLLHPAYTVADFFLHLHFQGDHIQLVGENFIHQLQALHRIQLLQNALAVLGTKVDAVTDVVSQLTGVLTVQHFGDDLIRQIRHHLPILAENGVGLTHNSLYAAGHLAGKIVLHLHHIGLEKGPGLPKTANAALILTVYQHTHGGIGGFYDLQHTANGAQGVKILFVRVGHSQLPLGHQEDLLALLHSVVQRQHGDLALYIKPGVLAGENRQPAQGQDGNIHSCLFHRGRSFRLHGTAWEKRGGTIPRLSPIAHLRGRCR